ncbi:MAG: hypothetical protein LBN21_00745 [Treponema sp.]|jgi:hypothetical protein|nr:hypothetical protein [Treponema sp.]
MVVITMGTLSGCASGAIEGAASAVLGDQNATRYTFYLPVGEKGKQLYGSGITKGGYVKFAQKKN